ncbi:MAG: hypothetical protein DRN66_03280 [Candidatus Nanohalarchaeota archaeon]|nr:MAG: hypothetical protein DRN66_03280 [Candidatus Nanohaloarchaeota archaeon]
MPKIKGWKKIPHMNAYENTKTKHIIWLNVVLRSNSPMLAVSLVKNRKTNGELLRTFSAASAKGRKAQKRFAINWMKRHPNG